MAPSIDFIITAPTPLADFAAELTRLLNIELVPAVDNQYEYRALTLTLDLYQLDAAGYNAAGRDFAGGAPDEHHYHIAINGIFGTEEQRTKWTQDWAFNIHQTLKAQKYRLRQVDSKNKKEP